MRFTTVHIRVGTCCPSDGKKVKIAHARHSAAGSEKSRKCDATHKHFVICSHAMGMKLKLTFSFENGISIEL